MATKKSQNPSDQYAVIQLGAKQYIVQVGDKILAEKVDLKDGETLTVKEVLLLHSDKSTDIGTPFLASASVDLVLNQTMKGEKIDIRKFRAKSRYRRSTGHRQTLSQFTVQAINSK